MPKKTFNEETWQAEQVVRDAFMDTPIAKQQVKEVAKNLKAQKVKVKKAVRKKIK